LTSRLLSSLEVMNRTKLPYVDATLRVPRHNAVRHRNDRSAEAETSVRHQPNGRSTSPKYAPDGSFKELLIVGHRQLPSPTGTAISSGGSFRHSATFAEA
jgi:hypothetical protein